LADRHVYHDYRVRWQNYRAFKDTGWLTIKPLTILLGSNNAGKTSIVSPLLVMNQTVASRDKITPLISRGSLIDAGNFQDLLHNHDASAELKFSFDFHTHDSDNETRPVGHYTPGGIRATFVADGTSGIASLSKYEIVDLFRRSYISLTKGSSGFTLRGIKKSDMELLERQALRKHEPTNFLFSPSGALYEAQVLSRKRNGADAESEAFSAAFSEYIGTIGYTFQEVVEILRKLSYIGPLRDRPRRHYDFSGEMPLTVGPRGQNTANLLKRRYEELKEGLNQWVQRFDLGDSLEVIDRGADVFSIVLRRNGADTNLADLGFGASQVLPLIVQSLVAPTGALTIAEQPEVHLNPRLQSVLAELFVDMAASNHRVVVETHSEHLFLAVRRLIASGHISHERVAVYFVERDEQKSTIREISLNENGGIAGKQWPRGFFDDALKESMALAKAQATRNAEGRSS
jgi:predicted ATPase